MVSLKRYLRGSKFLKKLIKNDFNKSCIITHNVFLRVLIERASIYLKKNGIKYTFHI